MWEKGLTRKLRIIAKIVTSKPGKHITRYLKRSNNNLTMKFDQLIEYKVKNIFVQKLCRKRDKETGFRPLLFIFFLNFILDK